MPKAERSGREEGDEKKKKWEEMEVRVTRNMVELELTGSPPFHSASLGTSA